MELVQKVKKALQKGRSVSLPAGIIQTILIDSIYRLHLLNTDSNQAAHVLLPYVVQNQIRLFARVLLYFL